MPNSQVNRILIIKNSLQILQEFLNSKRVELDLEKYLLSNLVNSNDYSELPSDIVKRIIADAHLASVPILKQIAEELSSKHNIFLGRTQKEHLKKYIDYDNDFDFENFVQSLREVKKPDTLQIIIDEFVREHPREVEKAVNEFMFNLKNAIKHQNYSRIQDYLIFIYSRLVAMNERRTLSLEDIFNENSSIIRKEFKTTPHSYESLYRFCIGSQKEDRFHAINKFNSEYLRILEQNGNKMEKNAVIYLNITQDLFDKYKDKKKFYSSLFSFTKKAYDNIQNHKSLVVKIENIMINDINIKWEIYSYLTIFAEKFNRLRETRFYYLPEEICSDFFEQKFKIKLSKEEISLLRKYYRDEVEFNEIAKSKSLNVPNSKEIIDDFKHIYVGFTFIDCIILQNEKRYPNSIETQFIENNNELLLIFLKHAIDDRKIPCPICGSLKISGNSFPEIGIRSWECKNPMCSDRSKTNRGKRYSARAILMQNGNLDFNPENTISRNITSQWRRDIVEKQDLESLYHMIVKYYSYVGDAITAVNADQSSIFKIITCSEKRVFKEYGYEAFVHDVDYSLYEQFFESLSFSFIHHFIYDEEITSNENSKFKEIYNSTSAKIILGNCLNVLHAIRSESIHHMVTSPPYYNAREYSQWENLYQYLSNMYQIVKEAQLILKEGGVFFFNVGDTFDNEKTIVKSKMGEKRIPLGAYIILLFKKAGFEILDNVIWNKGEPQSNRHKNDGNFTPYYQRPTNCYEHMFIFKKPGAKLKLNKEMSENLIKNNIQKITPVHKIGPGGINRHGHSAPFPQYIPLMSTLCFTNVSEVVLDPFAGSNTSLLAAAKHNRIGIGIEINKRFVELSIQKAKNVELDVDVIHFESGLCESFLAKIQN